MTFIKNLSYYFIANVISKVVAFGLFLYVSTILTPQDYGLLAIINSFINNAGSLVFLGLGGVILTNFLDTKDKISLINDINNIFYRAFFLFAFVSFIIFILWDFEYKNTNLFSSIIVYIWILLSVFMAFYSDIAMNILRMKNEINKLVKILLASTFLSAIFVLVALQFIQSFHILLISTLISYLLFFSYMYIHHKESFKIKTKNIFKKDILSISIPIFITGIATTFLTSIDKYMLAMLINIESVGIYEIALRFGKIYDIVIAVVFTTVYMPWLLNKLKIDFEKFLYFNIVLSLLNFILIFFVYLIPNEIFGLLANMIGDDFTSSVYYIKFTIIYSMIIHSLIILNITYYYLKKTKIIMYITFVMLLFNLILNMYLIPAYEIYGAIFSSYISCLAGVVLSIVIQMRIKNIRTLNNDK